MGRCWGRRRRNIRIFLSRILGLILLSCVPNSSVVVLSLKMLRMQSRAYYEPNVNDGDEQFSWSGPDLDGLRAFVPLLLPSM